MRVRVGVSAEGAVDGGRRRPPPAGMPLTSPRKRTQAAHPAPTRVRTMMASMPSMMKSGDVSSSSMQAKPTPTMPRHTHPFHCRRAAGGGRRAADERGRRRSAEAPAGARAHRQGLKPLQGAQLTARLPNVTCARAGRRARECEEMGASMMWHKLQRRNFDSGKQCAFSAACRVSDAAHRQTPREAAKPFLPSNARPAQHGILTSKSMVELIAPAKTLRESEGAAHKFVRCVRAAGCARKVLVGPVLPAGALLRGSRDAVGNE